MVGFAATAFLLRRRRLDDGWTDDDDDCSVLKRDDYLSLRLFDQRLSSLSIACLLSKLPTPTISETLTTHHRRPSSSSTDAASALCVRGVHVQMGWAELGRENGRHCRDVSGEITDWLRERRPSLAVKLDIEADEIENEEEWDWVFRD
nr:SKP1/ASK1-interacting protein 2 [Ipomoea batatas]